MWEEGAHLLEFFLDRVGRVQGVGAGGLTDGERRGKLSVLHDVDVVGGASQFGSSDILDPHDRSVGVGTEGNVGELVGGLQHALDDDRGVQALPRLGRSPPELTGGDLDVVCPQGGDDVLNGHLIVVQLVRVEPDPHGVFGTEDLHLSHAGNPGDDLLQVGLGVILQVDSAHASVFRDQADDEEVVLRGFADRDPLALNDRRQVGHGQLKLVLNLRPGEIGIGSWGEGHLYPGSACGVACGRHVEKFIETRHLLFDDLGDAVFNGLRRGSRVKSGDGDRRRGDGRVL